MRSAVSGSSTNHAILRHGARFYFPGLLGGWCQGTGSGHGDKGRASYEFINTCVLTLQRLKIPAFGVITFFARLRLSECWLKLFLKYFIWCNDAVFVHHTK